MKFYKVSSLPKTMHRKPNNDLAAALEEFMNMNVKYVQVVFSMLEFEGCYVAGTVLNRASKNAGLPVKARVRNGQVYLERTDM